MEDVDIFTMASSLIVTTNFLEKYRPVTLSDIVGNHKATVELSNWAHRWPHEKTAALLYGKPGTGKTASAHAVGHDMGWEVIELNASDQRTQRLINRIAGEASHTDALSGGRRLIILDEVDNLHGNADRGGAKAVTDLVKKTTQPIILTANDLYGVTTTLRGNCKLIQFHAIREDSIRKVLVGILKNEGTPSAPEFLDDIIKNAHGDLRSAINDLQANIDQMRPELTQRDRALSIFDVIRSVFTARDMTHGLQLSYGLDETPEDLIHWIDENLPRAYSGEALLRGFKVLSKADIYLGRTRRRQSYSLWRYATELMTCGVNVAVASQARVYGKYSPPTHWMKLGQTRTKRLVRDAIAAKISRASYTSIAHARSDILPLLQNVAQHDASKLGMLDLTIEELAYLMNAKKESSDVVKAFEQSQKLRK